jgi:hypothetical protein
MWLTQPATSLAALREAAEFSRSRPCSKGYVVAQLSQYYHRRAEEMRIAAIEARSSDNRDTLRLFASHFDRLADEAETAEQEQLGNEEEQLEQKTAG